MRTAAHARVPRFLSGALFLGALSLLTAAGCGDDGLAESGSADGSTGTPTGGGPTSTAPVTTAGTTAATGSTTTDGSSDDDGTTGSSTSSLDTEVSSSSSGEDSTGGDTTEGTSTRETTGATSVDVPFTVHDTSDLELTARVPTGWVVVTTAAQWASFTDAPVPAGVTFPAQSVLFGSRGPQPYPGHALVVDTLSWQGDTLSVDGEQADPADDCETYEFIWPADTLISFDALDGKIEDVVDQTVTTEAACAGGAGDSMDCDLDAPCAPGLLCAGIIRSTVFLSDPGGLCLDSSYRGTFSGSAVTIPADGATVEVAMEVAGLTTVDMDVTILLDLNHPAPEELVIELRNPDGNVVSVANLQTTELHPGGIPIVPNGFSGDESVNGTWSLIVTDTVDNDNSGSVQGWDLEIMSRFD